jgi:hypothetical protein
MPYHGPPGDPHGTGQSNPWRWWFEEDPGLTYQLQRPQTGSPSFMDYYRAPSTEGRVFGDYQVAQGRKAEQGLAPDINWYDYLADYPFLLEYSKLSPRQRGGPSERNFAPRASWNIPPGY